MQRSQYVCVDVCPPGFRRLPAGPPGSAVRPSRETPAVRIRRYAVMPVSRRRQTEQGPEALVKRTREGEILPAGDRCGALGGGVHDNRDVVAGRHTLAPQHRVRLDEPQRAGPTGRDPRPSSESFRQVPGWTAPSDPCGALPAAPISLRVRKQG